MRALLVVVVLVLLMVLGGWLVFRNDGNSASVELRTDRVEADARQAVENTRHAIDNAAQGIDHSADQSIDP